MTSAVLTAHASGLARLVTSGEAAFALTEDGELVPICGKAKGEVLASVSGEAALALVGAGERKAFAKGNKPVDAFAAGAADVAVARSGSLELWSIDGERRWQRRSPAILAVTLTGEQVLSLEAEGALVFSSRADGASKGTLRLASPEPTGSWRLESIGGEQAVLALGEWLVWVDAEARKTVRRVKARAKVRALASDGRWVACGLEDGWVQVFDVATGEALAGFEAHRGAVDAVALTPSRLYSGGGGGRGQIRGWDRDRLAAAAHAASPVVALGARAELVAAADKEGHVHLSRAGRHVGSFASGHPVLSVGVDEDEGVWAATPHAVVCAARPWTSARPIVLCTAASAADADAAYVFAGTEAGAVDVFDRERGVFVTTYELSDTIITAVARLPGALLAVGTGGLDGRVIVVDVTVPGVRHRVEAHGEGFGITALATDARGRIVASGSEEGLVALIDPARGRVIGRIDLGETPLSLAFEPSGLRLACALADGTAAVVTFGAGGAHVSRPVLRGVTRVVWGQAGPIAGFADGTVQPLRSGRASLRGTSA